MKRHLICRSKHILLTVVFITILSMALSYSIIGVMNPLRSLSGLFHILLNKSPIAVISEDPRIILAQPDEHIFIEYMQSVGFIEIEAKRLGSIRVFANENAEESIVYRQNRFFSRWQWEKTYENKGRSF